MGDDPFRYEFGRLAIAGVRVGTHTDQAARTGVTVLLLPPGTRGGVEVAGGGPATRETDCLRPENLVPGPDAVVFSGGSASGLASADGVVDHLRRLGVGFAAGPVRIPIVPAAAIFDLGVGEPCSPGPDDGRLAAEAACDDRVPEGAFGAGSGASVGKMVPGQSTPAGQGAVTLEAPDGLRVAALAVVNAVGSVIDANGHVMAGPRDGSGEPLDPLASLAFGRSAAPGRQTTLVAVVTDSTLDKAQLTRVARMAHDGLARAIEPVHTLWDGDVVFAMATGQSAAADPSRVGALAARAVAIAIRRAVTALAPGGAGPAA